LKRPQEAVEACRKAIEIDPKNASSHYNHGLVLAELKRPQEAVEAYHKAIEIDPKYANAYNNLGSALAELKRPQEAVEAYRKAIEIDPKNASSHYNHGLVLLAQGRFAAARDAAHRCLELLSQGDPRRPSVTRLLQQCEQGLALEKKLAAIRTDQEQPVNVAELLALARLSQLPSQKLYVTSARFYAEAFAHDAKLANDLQRPHRYNAACSAALAAAGQAEDARLLPDRVAFRLRVQALDWLRADLAAYAKLAVGNDAAAKQQVRQRLTHWQQDEDLSSVREAKALAQLSEPEQQAWRQLWDDVGDLLKQVADPGPS
jgi:Tfp pilus assembly protein PilF